MVIGLLAALAGPPRYTGPVTPVLQKPFEGEYRFSGVFDHRKPRPNDHLQLTAWGSHTWGRATHAAYDWPMPIGTPILAAADGVVAEAGEQETTCPNGMETTVILVHLDHTVGKRTIRTSYLHLSSTDLEVGSEVRAGQVIGASGNTGCSSGPHLHFMVSEPWKKGYRVIDPYGWDGPYPDPNLGVIGRHSEYLWLPGKAPLLFRPSGPTRNPSDGPVRIANLRGMAWKDDVHPNNEFVALTLQDDGPRKVNLAGWSVRNVEGDAYTFGDVKLARGDRLFLYTGPGEDSADTLFWGRPRGVWSDLGDCVILSDDTGRVRHRLWWGRPADDGCARR